MTERQPDHVIVVPIDQRRRSGPRSKLAQAIYEGGCEFWEAAFDEVYFNSIATGTSAAQVSFEDGKLCVQSVELRENRLCICCGAPAGLVQHD